MLERIEQNMKKLGIYNLKDEMENWFRDNDKVISYESYEEYLENLLLGV